MHGVCGCMSTRVWLFRECECGVVSVTGVCHVVCVGCVHTCVHVCTCVGHIQGVCCLSGVCVSGICMMCGMYVNT